ncbi:MAG: DEAD/DEAH box helicase [Peptococcaceae bacterium]|nr:DEAD/DEAH box helicase [Peptococcaceae bacterium]
MNARIFEDFNLKPELIKAVAVMGFETPTPIQKEAIPLILAGRDVLGQAQTGTGKTAAFGLPMLHLIALDAGIQGLVMCPTRELAVQVAKELNSLGRFLKARAVAIYGGQSFEVQLRALRKNPQIIVATPGRLLDHIRRKNIELRGISIVVLDEADEMLDMGFRDDIQTILKQCPRKRQTLMFSATLADQVRELAHRFMSNPQFVTVTGAEVTVPKIEQRFYKVNPQQKVESLCRILDVENPPVALIFCRTKKGVAELVEELQARGYAAEAIHGDLSQRERDNVMNRFRQGTVELLIATDVAARGLDIQHVTHVINFDIPQDTDSYVHRIGRTGRAGREGVAITLVEPREIKQLRFIERVIRTSIEERSLPTLDDAMERRKELIVEKVKSAIRDCTGDYQEMATELLDRHDARLVVGAVLKLLDDEGPELERAELGEVDNDLVAATVPVGRMQGMNANRILDKLANNFGLQKDQVGKINIGRNMTTVEVPGYLVGELSGLFHSSGGYKSCRRKKRGFGRRR